MSGSNWTWLLGGALAASLGWNAMTLQRAPASAPAAGTTRCEDVLAKLGDLGLTSAQQQELTLLLRQCDSESARSDARAVELSQELRTLLRDPAADAAAIRARARELGAVRAAAVESCIESSLALRRTLAPAQLGRLLDACCEDGCCGNR